LSRDLNYRRGFERELQELETSHERLVACLTEKKGMEDFISKTTLEMIRRTRGMEEVSIQGEIRNVAIMFTDVRNFTRFSELFDVKKVFEIINAYLSIQSKLVERHNGILDKFLGDGIMAFFEGKDKELDALRAALMIQHGVRELNYMYTERAILHVGIGLDTGPVFMGVLGEEGRKDYTAIGDHVNTASRVCGLAGKGEVLFTKPFMEKLPSLSGIRVRETVNVKGKKEPLEVYCYELDVGYPDIQHLGGIVGKPTKRRKRKGNTMPSDVQYAKEDACQMATGLTRKDKELIAVVASIASGCQQCADYHVVKVFDDGATVKEVEKAVQEALGMIEYAGGIMQKKAYSLLKLPRKTATKDKMTKDVDRMSVLLRLAALVALNNITGIEVVIQLAVHKGVRLEDLQLTIALAKVVAEKAREFADDSISKSLGMSNQKQAVSLDGCHFSNQIMGK